MLHGRMAVIIGLFLKDPLLYTPIQMWTSSTGPLLFRTRKKKSSERERHPESHFKPLRKFLSNWLCAFDSGKIHFHLISKFESLFN
jgi:hypothetical protein